MYEEKSKKGLNINWKSLIIKLAILFVVFFIILWIISLVNKPKKEEKASNITTNLQTMKEAALDYFMGSNLPESVNGKKKITLQEMVLEKLLIEFKDQDDKTCNGTESYAEATKINSTDYSIKVKLVCTKDTDYVINTIHVEKDANTETNNGEASIDNTTTNNGENLSNNTSTSTNNSSNKNNTTSGTSNNTSNKNNTSTSNKNNTSNSNNNSTNTSNKNNNSSSNNNSNIAISNTCAYGKKEYTTVYPLAYVVSGNCAVSKATLGQAAHMNTVTMMGSKEYSKLYNEVNTLKNQTGANLIVSDGEYIPVMNASGNGYVGYQIRFQVKQKTNYLEKTIYSYYINQNGERVVVLDNRSSLNNSNNNDNSNNGTTSSDIKVTSVSFSKSSLDLYVGDTSNLKVTINPTNATNKTITWSSSNTKVASVSSTGKVTAKRVGTAIITATVDGKSDTIKIYVEEEEEATNVYCERVTERIYSISYISKNSLNLGKILDYEILLPIDTTNIRDLDIEYGVATDYVSAYNYWKNRNIIFAGGSTSNLDPGSATNLKAYSLKTSQFHTIVSYEGIYDNVLDFRIRNYLDSKSNLGLDYKGNYYLPIYIDVAYTNNSKCKTLTDSEAKSTKYSNYVKIN